MMGYKKFSLVLLFFGVLLLFSLSFAQEPLLIDDKPQGVLVNESDGLIVEWTHLKDESFFTKQVFELEVRQDESGTAPRTIDNAFLILSELNADISSVGLSNLNVYKALEQWTNEYYPLTCESCSWEYCHYGEFFDNVTNSTVEGWNYPSCTYENEWVSVCVNVTDSDVCGQGVNQVLSRSYQEMPVSESMFLHQFAQYDVSLSSANVATIDLPDMIVPAFSASDDSKRVVLKVVVDGLTPTLNENDEWFTSGVFSVKIGEFEFWDRVASSDWNETNSSTLAANTVSYYKMDEEDTSGSGSIIDAVGFNNGTNNGASNSTGKINTGYDFDGVSDYVSITHSTRLDFLGDQSFSAWIKKTSSTAKKTIFVNRNSDNYWVTIQSDKLAVYLGGIGGYYFSDNTINIGDWSFISFSFDDTANTLTMNVDGIITTHTGLTGTRTASGTFDIIMGRHATLSSEFIDSVLDEVALFNTSLSQSEISFLYDNNTPSSEQQYPYTLLSIPANDTCSYGGSGNWVINLSDFCFINSNYTVSGNLSFVDDGNVSFNSSVSANNLDVSGVTVGDVVWMFPFARLIV